MSWFKTAISTGAFEEQSAEDGSSRILCEDDTRESLEDSAHDNVLSRSLEDVGHDPVGNISQGISDSSEVRRNLFYCRRS